MKSNDTGTGFTQVTFPQYVFSQRSNFVDINNDGHLDAFVCHEVVAYKIDSVAVSLERV